MKRRRRLKSTVNFKENPIIISIKKNRGYSINGGSLIVKGYNNKHTRR